VGEPNILLALGLRTSSNELGATPAGGLRKAQNCVLMGDGLVGPRRGQYPLTYAPSDIPRAMGLFGDTLIVHTEGDTLEYDSGSAFVSYGTYAPPEPTKLRMKFAAAQECLYATTDDGIVRLDVKQNAPVLAGGPRTKQISSAGLHATTVGYLAAGSSVAYRLVFGVKDVNGIVHLGPPSSRFVVDNLTGETNYDGSAKNVDITFPVTARSGDEVGRFFWQLYRSKSAVSYTTVDGTLTYVPPNDELKLCQEAYFTTAEIAAGSVSIVDTTPDDFLGTPLYTNANSIEGGILQQNDEPPLAWDIAVFDQRMFYANTRRMPQMVLQIIGVGEGQDGYTGIRLNDQLTINGVTMTAAGAYSAVDLEFQLFTSDPDPAVNIENTAQSIVNLFNATAGAGYAQLLSDPDDTSVNVPGKILFMAPGAGDEVWDAVLTTKRVLIAIGGLVRSAGSTVTATTSDPHGLVTGDTVCIEEDSGVDANFAPGTFTVTVTGASTFTYTQAGANVASVESFTERRLTPEPQFAWNPPPPVTAFDIAVGGLVRSAGVVAVTSSVPHGVSIGMYVNIEPVGAEDPNFPAGSYVVVGLASDTGFNVTWTGSDATSSTAYRSGAQVTADAQRQRNGISYSKTQQPEAVPSVNSFFVGAPDKNILRIIPTQNYLFVFKEDGVFVVSPTGSAKFPYRVDPLDPTIILYAPDSAVTVHGKIHALTNQGVVEVASSGVRIVSRDIEDQIFTYFGESLANVKVKAFGLPHETDRLYSLWLPALENANTAPYNTPRAYVFSTQAKAWTTWELDRRSGIVRPSDDRLYMGGPDPIKVYIGRNSKTAVDYVDGTSTPTFVSYVSATRVLNVTSAASISVGDAVADDDGNLWIVTAKNSNALTLSGDATYTDGSALIAYEAIPIDIEWRTVAAPPADMRLTREMHLHSRLRDFYKATLVFASELVTSEVTQDIYPTKTAEGTTPSYEVPSPDFNFPGLPVRPKKLRVALPQDIARAAYFDFAFRIDEAFALWTLNGFTLVDVPVGPKGQR
jgi:hypothetical protein